MLELIDITRAPFTSPSPAPAAVPAAAKTEVPSPTPEARPEPRTTADANRLLNQVQGRDPEAWRLLLDLYGPVVHSWCRRAGLQAQDIADVAQDVFCALMRRVGQFHMQHNE